MPIRVLIADDHGVLRAGLSALLSAEPDLEVVGEAGTGEEALRWPPNCIRSGTDGRQHARDGGHRSHPPH
jgi:DNA-binding NarL/FixJ family response regulator